MSGIVTIDGQKVEIGEAKNLLEMVRRTGIDLPTFCYNSELSVYGACRMCVVETDRGQVISSCSTPPEDGMNIKTNTPRLMRIRKMMLELLLANHDRECTSCPKSGTCKLQELSKRFGVDEIPFPLKKELKPKDLSSVSVGRDENKCILCGDCVRTCAEIQGIGAIGFANRGAKSRVMCAFERGLADTDCINCGQCIAACPTGALTSPSQVSKVWAALRDPSKHVVISVAPAVRVAIGEHFGYEPGYLQTGRMVAAIKKLGFDEVFDTSYTADVTTIEETNEFLGRFTKKENLPLFTSCCPAWVKAVETLYPELIKNLSSCKSPQAMYGAIMKDYYREELKRTREEIYVVSVMPCVAKKFEAQRPELGKNGNPDVDAVITTDELANMIKSAGIVFNELLEDSFDIPFGFATGSGVIFGMSGGVATSVVREAKFLLAGVRSNDVEMTDVEGYPGLRKADIPLPGGAVVRLGVISGMGNVRRMLDGMKKGEIEFDIIEVMACPGGCISGGGQPIPNTIKQRAKRTVGMRAADSRHQIRVAHENVLVTELYNKWLEEPGSHIAHHSLHTSYSQRERETLNNN